MSGTSVPPGFTLPWNTTRTMADVWGADLAATEAKREPNRSRSNHGGRKPYRRSQKSRVLTGATLNGKPIGIVVYGEAQT